MQKTLDNLSRTEQLTHEVNAEKQAKVAALERELREQEDRLARVSKQVYVVLILIVYTQC